MPLSLGYTSIGEYGDFQLQTEENPEELKEKINNALPEGLIITELIKLKEGVKNTMASVCAASYDIYFDETISPEDIKNNLSSFINQNEILVMKKTKKNFKETDIKPDILGAEDISADGKGVLKVLVNAGSVKNLKPESVAEGFCMFINKEYNRYKTAFRRNEMYMKNSEEKLVPLTDGVGEN